MQVALPAIKVSRSLFSSLHLPVFVPQEELAQLRALVPLGAGVHAQAEVPDTSRICMHVALGFHPGGMKLVAGLHGYLEAARGQPWRAKGPDGFS